MCVLINDELLIWINVKNNMQKPNSKLSSTELVECIEVGFKNLGEILNGTNQLLKIHLTIMSVVLTVGDFCTVTCC